MNLFLKLLCFLKICLKLLKPELEVEKKKKRNVCERKTFKEKLLSLLKDGTTHNTGIAHIELFEFSI